MKDIELTSKLLSNKVTGVNFYLKDLSDLKKLELKRKDLQRKAKSTDRNNTKAIMTSLNRPR